MQGLISCVLILGFVTSCLCKKNVELSTNTFDVRNYGAYGDGKSDDSEAFLRAWQITCGTEGTTTLVIPSNYVFMVRNIKMNGPCQATKINIQLRGHIVAPPRDAWRDDKSSLITISNVNNLTIDGNEGVIDGYGSTWWNKCKGCLRPSLLAFHACNNLVVNYLYITNSPRGHITINGCEGARFSYINIHAPVDSPNTDGIDISSSKNILIQDSTIGSGDDCIAINGGSSYINAIRIVCGPGHGISIGSLGENGAHDTVEEVYVKNCSFIGTTNGARIKTWPGGSGYARRITFEQIKLKQVRNPIIIDQFYGHSKPPKNGAAVKVSDVTYHDFQGTSADDLAINLNCSSLGCFNVVLNQIKITNSKQDKQTYASCKNVYGRVKFVVPVVPCLSN